ncbi:MAG TPA: ABC transporter ATP-binding protein [Pyrinomonadaceae bacterium]|nr:ABC transporter ATP-binding protein [Pyrinomonadaceae bacterium]
MRDLRRLLKYLLPHTGSFIIATVAMVAVALLEAATGALVVPVFSQALARGQAQRTPTLFGLQHLIPPSGLAAWRTIAVLLVTFTIAKGIAEYFSTYLMARIGQSSVLRLRQDLYSHLLKQGAKFFQNHRTNYLVSRLISSAAAIENSVTYTLRDFLREGLTFIALLAGCFYFDWKLTMGSLLIAPPLALLTLRFGSSLRKLARESLESSKRLADTAHETLANQTIVKAYRGEEREQGRFTKVAERIKHANLRSASISGMSPPIIELIGILFVCALLFFGEREIRLGYMDLAQFLAFMFFLTRSYDPLRKLSRLHNSFSQTLTAAQHVWEVMDEHEEIPEKPNAIALPPLHEAIEFHDVHFGYSDESRSVLHGVSLSVPAGRVVALVGESGGGKSTLTKLIPRFHDPTSGSVTWDGIDFRDAQVASLRQHIALVTQETVLFNDSVLYNISYAKPDATAEQIEDAARTALAHDFILELPKGYDTLIGERGIFLSGGQRQRLAIARAVLSNAPVLILDEATSALDAESESLVQRAIANLIRDRTTIVIAHRLSTVRRADLIVVMEAGRIIEQGTHAELLARGGQYQRLYELQFADEEELSALIGQ